MQERPEVHAELRLCLSLSVVLADVDNPDSRVLLAEPPAVAGTCPTLPPALQCMRTQDRCPQNIPRLPVSCARPACSHRTEQQPLYKAV